MLEMHGKHHDEEFCIVYPVVRKAITSMLRGLGMEAMYKGLQTFKFHDIGEPV